MEDQKIENKQKFWQWYVARQNEPCGNCKRIMSTHSVRELIRCGLAIGAFNPEDLKSLSIPGYETRSK